MSGLMFNFLFIAGIVICLNAENIEKIFIQDNKPALKGSNIRLVCQLSVFPSGGLTVYKSDNRLPSSLSGLAPLTNCFPSLCLATVAGRYTFSADSSNVFINITNVNRSEDQKWWTCVVQDQRKYMLFTVITVPASLQFENPLSQSQDLAENAVQLKCSTGCCYPQPAITWYYSEAGKDNLQIWSLSGTASDTTTGCSDSEKKYLSTLYLPKYTTFPGNLQKTVKFKCSIQSFTGISEPIYTSYSTDVLFAVQVSTATLKDGTKTVSGQLQVVNGKSKTLTCETSVCRPAATVVWYIGTERQRSTYTSFTFIPDNSYNDKMVYCKAFNTQPEGQAVISYTSKLFVQVQVSSATLKDGSSRVSQQLQVVSGVSKTLTCETSVSRPAATIVWYIGGEEEQRSTSNSLTFIPSNSDHSSEVYCKAFNTQQEKEAVISNKSALYVKVRISNVILKDGTHNVSGTLQIVSGINKTLTCETSASRPEATIVWYIGTKEKQRSTSNTFTFIPDNSYNNSKVYCKAFNTPQEGEAVISYQSALFLQEQSSVKSFYIGENVYLTNATYGEYDVDIKFTCIVEGRPASTVDIIFEGSVLKTSSNTSMLRYSFQEITCTDGGDYICRCLDGFGKATNRSVSLYVECAPRPVRQILDNITTELGVPVNLSFTAIAYPEPGPNGFNWYKDDRSIWIALLSNEDFKIASAGLETILTIANVSRKHFGKYRVTVDNRIGIYNQILYLSEKENTDFNEKKLFIFSCFFNHI